MYIRRKFLWIKKIYNNKMYNKTYNNKAYNKMFNKKFNKKDLKNKKSANNK